MLRESENEDEDATDEDVDEIERDAQAEEMPSKSWNVSAFSNPSVKKTQSLNCKKRPEQLRQQQTPSNTPLSRYAGFQKVLK